MLIDTFVDTFANGDDDYEITFLLSFPLQIPILILLLVSGGHIVEMDAVDHVDLSTKSTIVKQARVRAFQEAAMDNESCDKSATDIECRKKLLCTQHLLRLTSSTTVTPFTMSMFMFCKLLN